MPKQIGWSQESNLLYDIMMQLDRLLSVAGGGGGGLLIYPNLAAFPPVGDPAFIYLAQDTNKIYYWNAVGLTYTEISPGLTSVGLSMPSAFTVTNNPLTANGTIAVTGAGLVSQYVRGDGTLSDFPGSTGGGASVNYYINGGTNQGTFGGNTYYEMSKVAVTAAGVNFSTAVDGYVAQFITDPGDPSLLQIPGGSWNIQFYLNASSAGGSPSFYVELYKYNGAVFTLLGSSASTPEQITGGTSVDLYYTSVSVPTTTLLVTDRLAIRVYVVASGRTITLYTQDNRLGQIQTTFTSGMTALNGLTDQVQYLATGTSGTDFGITSSAATHTFNLPTASSTNTGKLAACDWTKFNSAVGAAVEIVGAGTNSTIRCGVSNTASACYAASLGGQTNAAGGAYSFIGAGGTNTIGVNGRCSAIVAGSSNSITCSTGFIGAGTSNQSTCSGASVVGGSQNCATNQESFVGGGSLNKATGIQSFIGGGIFNCATTAQSVIAGGYNGRSCGVASFLGAGCDNVSSGAQSFVGAGCTNTASGLWAGVDSGCRNIAQAVGGFIGGGVYNNVCNLTSGCLALGAAVAGGVGGNTTGGTWSLASCSFTVAPTICDAGQYSFIGGGFQNSATGNYSAVLGGSGNVASGAYSGAFGCNLTASAACTFYVNNHCVCGNTVLAGGFCMTTTSTGLRFPNLTTAQRNAIVGPATGMAIYNTTTGANESYNGSTWKTVIDATLTSPLANQVLTYDGTKWVNQAAPINVAANLFNYYNFI